MRKYLLVLFYAFTQINAIGQFKYAYLNAGGADFTDGGSWVDYDNDGWQDIFITSSQQHPNYLYRNNRDGTFTLITSTQLTKLPGYINDGSTWGDFNNDGLEDVFIANDTIRLFVNKGKGAFESVPIIAPGAGNNQCPGGSWIDLNNDGLLDLFHGFDSDGKCMLINKGDNTFSNILLENVYTGENDAVVWCDYDNDNDQDFFRINEGRLYQNEGHGSFTKLPYPDSLYKAGSSCSWGDFDSNGWMDLLAGPRDIFMNYGGTLSRKKFLLDDLSFGIGSTLGDFDNDGDLDIFVSRDFGNANLYLNDGLANFTSPDINTSPYGKAGSANADYDNDGDLDIFSATWSGALVVFRNDAVNANNWIKLKLIGSVSNRSGIGARVNVELNGKKLSREVQSLTGQYGENSLLVHFGLGEANKCSVTIDWPSGIRQTLSNLAANQSISIKEDTTAITAVIPDLIQPALTVATVLTADQLQVSLSGDRSLPVHCALLNNLGIQVISYDIIAGVSNSAIPLSIAGDGMYYLVLDSGTQRVTKRIVKVQ